MRFAAPVPLFIWSLFLASLGGVLAVWSGQLLPPLLLGAAAVGSFSIACYLLLRGRATARAPKRYDRSWLMPEMSVPTAFFGIAVVFICIGAVIGFWLVLVGAGMCGFALFGVGRELYMARQLSAGRGTETEWGR
jgi:hypothetical protein